MTAPGASLSPCNTSPSRRSLAKPCRDPATSTTTPSCCWISINLSFPLAGSRRRRCRCSVRVLNAEVPSVRHSVIGDLDHGEYDSINPFIGTLPLAIYKVIDRLPFETALLALHIWTECLIQMTRVFVADISEETQTLMDQGKGLSNYMMHLLIVNPTMLPVNNNVDEVVANLKKKIQVRSNEMFDKASIYDLLDETSRILWDELGLEEGVERMLLPEHGPHAVFGVLIQVWLWLLIYAAGKCRPEEHARTLAMGGELITFVWLCILHRGLGDQGSIGLYLMRPGTSGYIVGNTALFDC
ncbi:hypothetical protein VPH35_038039 [Triticum aestivum]